MQHLNRLSQLASAASQVAEFARSSETYRFNVDKATTFYLNTAHAEVIITRWEHDRIEIAAHLQAPFGWRVETDQDSAGVYFVAHRRPLVGGLAGATFHVSVPADAYLMLKLDDCRLSLVNVSGEVELPPELKALTVRREGR